MSDYKSKLAKLDKVKQDLQKPAIVEFVNSTEVHKQLDKLYETLGKANAQNQELNKELLDTVATLLSKMATQLNTGMKVTNLDQIKIEPKFTTPEIVVPKAELPKINVPAPTVIKEEDIYSKYKPADVVQDGSITYYGYLAKDGSWFINREIASKDGSKFRYTSGKDGYNKAFTKRAKHDYKYINEVEL